MLAVDPLQTMNSGEPLNARDALTLLGSGSYISYIEIDRPKQRDTASIRFSRTQLFQDIGLRVSVLRRGFATISPAPAGSRPPASGSGGRTPG